MEAKTARQRVTFAQQRYQPEVYEQIRRAARAEGLSASGWIRRQAMLALAAREQKAN